MVKPEWGAKRVCQSCATKFYDLGRHPIACPKCGTRFNPEVLLKSRRSRPAAAARSTTAQTNQVLHAEVEPKVLIAAADVDADLGADVETRKGVSGDEGGDHSVIEDASELGESEDVIDVAIAGDDEDD